MNRTKPGSGAAPPTRSTVGTPTRGLDEVPAPARMVATRQSSTGEIDVAGYGRRVITEEMGTMVDGVPSWLRTVLDAAMDAVVIIDQEGRVVFWNPAAARMFQRSREEVDGRNVAELIIPPELRRQHHEALTHSSLGRPGSILGRRVEVVGQREDGSRFPVELTITRTDRGHVVLYTGYLRDITAQRELTRDLRQSQSRLVAVSDRTRRDIERDLHDGAQQQLVGLSMLIAQARSGLATNSADADSLLERAGDVLVTTMREIRELARGVLPPALADYGVLPALLELARRSTLPVELSVPRISAAEPVASDAPAQVAGDTVEEPVEQATAHLRGDMETFGRWPAAVEITLYFLVAEALTNAAKHGGRKVQVVLQAHPAADDDRILHPAMTANASWEIVCRIHDDGPGGAGLHRGSGLIGLVDRVGAVGGTLDIESPPGGGTTLTARIKATPTGNGESS